MRFLPQKQHGPGVGVVDWLIAPRVQFYTCPELDHVDLGVRLSHIYNGTGDFIPSLSLVGAGDLIDFGDRLKITHWIEVRVVVNALNFLNTDPLSQLLIAGAESRISFSRQVSARRSTSGRGPLSRYTVACHIAKSVWQCICQCGGQWTLGDGTVVRYEDLILLELVKVSKGSHQVVLGYLEPARTQIQTQLAGGIADGFDYICLDITDPAAGQRGSCY